MKRKSLKYDYISNKLEIVRNLIESDKLSINYISKNSIELLGISVSKTTLNEICDDNNIKRKILISNNILCNYCNKQMSSTKMHTCSSSKKQKLLEIREYNIRNLIEKNEYSIYEIVNNSEELFGIDIGYGSLLNFCKNNNIKLKNLKESANSSRVRNKYVKTVNERYGVDNVSQSIIIKNKKEETCFKEYGVINPFQIFEVKEKSKKTMLEKYGVENAGNIPNIERNNGRISKIHRKVSDYLTILNIDHDNEIGIIFKKYNELLKRFYSPVVDIFIEEKNVVIEIYGDRWHCNPNMYYAEDIVQLWNGNSTAEQIWVYDKSRIQQIESFGMKVIILWENDINKNFDNVKSILDKLKD